MVRIVDALGDPQLVVAVRCRQGIAQAAEGLRPGRAVASRTNVDVDINRVHALKSTGVRGSARNTGPDRKIAALIVVYGVICNAVAIGVDTQGSLARQQRGIGMIERRAAVHQCHRLGVAAVVCEHRFFEPHLKDGIQAARSNGVVG